mmetsp:Transcript_26075/g.84158  ORF Transcript_26075/g.84158 Transcript_26075/m.84158 type:complete len:256 (+) Transcript_26075:3787-4554(+)
MARLLWSLAEALPWVSHATRNCRKAAPFTDVMSTMENNQMALSKRARSTPAPNETVCTSIAAARAPHTPPCTIDDKMRLHTPVNILPEPTTLRRLTFCDVQRCLRVLSGARHQQPSEGMGASPAAAQKPELHWQPHDSVCTPDTTAPPTKRSLRLTSTSPEPLRARLSKTPSVAHSTETQPAHEPIHSASRQSPTALVTPNPHSTDSGTRTNHPQNPPLAPLESPWKELSNEPLVAHSTKAHPAHDHHQAAEARA